MNDDELVAEALAEADAELRRLVGAMVFDGRIEDGKMSEEMAWAYIRQAFGHGYERALALRQQVEQ